MKQPTARNPYIVFAILLFSHIGCSVMESDETILRNEFDVPEDATVVSYSSSPDKPGWFGREGLKIDIVFQFDDIAFSTYLANAHQSGDWSPLPIPEEFLMRMGGIASSKEGILRSYVMQGREPPAEGSIHNPTADQLYDSFITSLPLSTETGLYQCRTAGDDIMHSPKRIIHAGIADDLNDFMLAVLDRETKRLLIHVSTRY